MGFWGVFPTNLHKPLIDAVDLLQCSRIAEREFPWSDTDNRAVFGMEANGSDTISMCTDVPEFPEVCERRHNWPGVLVKTITVVLIR